MLVACERVRLSLRLTARQQCAVREQRDASVALKLHLQEDDGATRQVMMQLNQEQLEKMLAHFAVIHKELLAR
ncbi:hypothetical protein PINS_up017837 [Pythium insidiosum]|nr:hypothetical protein PINS_up017837 [Pythium insidiosum]